MTLHSRPILSLILGVTSLMLPASEARSQGSETKTSPEHKLLEQEVGTWDAEVKTWMAPNSQPIISQGVETNTMLGSHWILSDYQGQAMGMTFKGRGQFGYDPIKKKYVGTWVDNFSPHLTVMEGTADHKAKTLTFYSQGIDVMTGKETTSKMISTLVDHDHKTFEIYAPVEGKEAQWWKKMEFHYTRRK